jgi:hypothetical protein
MHRAQDGFVSSHFMRRCLVKHALAHLRSYEIKKTDHAGLAQGPAGKFPCLGNRCGANPERQVADSHCERT